MKVDVDVRGGVRSWDVVEVERLALFALEHMNVPKSCELSVSLVGVEEIQTLNCGYRGIDALTDVLSFQCDDPFGCSSGDLPLEIGDVVIACDVVDEQRQGFETTFEEEASLMLVHSILHLLGYDHETDEERVQMEALEKEILEAYGLHGVR